MASYAGEQQQWAYAVEANYGTGTTPTLWPGLVQSYAVKPERNVVELRAGNSFEAQQLANVEFSSKGSFDTILQDGRLLFLGFNTGSTNVTGSPVNIHRLAISGTGAFPSCTWGTTRFGSTNLGTIDRGLKLTKMTLKCDYKDMLHLSADFTAKASLESGAAVAPTVQTTPPYIYAGGNIQIGGNNVTEVRVNEFNAAYNKEEQYYQASGASVTPFEIADLGVSYDGTLTLNFADYSKVSQFLGFSGATAMSATGSTFNVNMRYQKVGNANDYINVILSGCNLTSPGLDGERTGVIKQALKYKAVNCFVDISDTFLSGTGVYY